MTYDEEPSVLRCSANKFDGSLIGLFPTAAKFSSRSAPCSWYRLCRRTRDTSVLQFSCLPIRATPCGIYDSAVNEILILSGRHENSFSHFSSHVVLALTLYKVKVSHLDGVTTMLPNSLLFWSLSTDI